jgi:pimeloyl-ACP methyl ester carboxylesterase
VGVIGVPDAKWGSVPVAIVAFRPGRHEDAEALRAFVRERLSSFKVPARVVEVASIPRSPGGKQLRQSLAALASAGVPRHSLAGTTRIETGDGQRLGFRELSGPPGAPTIVLLHATLSTSRQLLRLAGRLRFDYRVLLPDRRGSGTSAMSKPGPVSIARHADDILAVLDAAGADRPVFFGHSFGALMTLEFAARHPDRVAGVVAYEPPYLAISPAILARFAGVGEAVAAAYSAGGPAAAAQFFVRAVAGDDAWERLGPAQQALLEVEGSGALADAAMPDLDPAGLARIGCPVVIATGDNSDDYYAPIADALAIVIPDAHRVRLPGLRHTAPITDPAPIAELIRKSKPGH